MAQQKKELTQENKESIKASIKAIVESAERGQQASQRALEGLAELENNLNSIVKKNT